jgi:hypothetical protein
MDFKNLSLGLAGGFEQYGVCVESGRLAVEQDP